MELALQASASVNSLSRSGTAARRDNQALRLAATFAGIFLTA
jgi:hypothetical protein